MRKRVSAAACAHPNFNDFVCFLQSPKSAFITLSPLCTERCAAQNGDTSRRIPTTNPVVHFGLIDEHATLHDALEFPL